MDASYMSHVHIKLMKSISPIDFILYTEGTEGSDKDNYRLYTL